MSKVSTDIDVYTFERILKDLCFIDLCNVAYTNLHLRDAARFEFFRRYKNRSFVFRLIDIKPEYFDETEEKITVYSLSFILRFLCCFGEMIRDVTLCFLDNDPLDALHVI